MKSVRILRIGNIISIAFQNNHFWFLKIGKFQIFQSQRLIFKKGIAKKVKYWIATYR